MWNAWVLWVFVVLHASNVIIETEDNSIQRLLCQCKMTSIVTKSSIIDDLGVWDMPLVCLFSLQNIAKKINEVDIYMFKVKKKGTRTRYEIYPELTIKAPRQR